ncbi:hypothetical protein EB118_10535 [bacterium]|nr:hypothetical protein [bacterium]NBX97624.1 hypothetical protein [bacterium]NDC94769.1 hypothetical protein [bacterium]NDD84555.1 hypothetical protein [bacterium]NDG30493.1 hypothetical protein [bacterium]
MTVSNMLAVVLTPSKMRYDANRSLTKTKLYKSALTSVLSLSLAVAFFVTTQIVAVFVSSKNVVFANEQAFIIPTTPTSEVPETQNSVRSYEQLQNVINVWAQKYEGKVSVTIAANDGRLLASSNQQKQYYSASIYKIYVAYIVSQDIDNGVYAADEIYLNDYTRADCLVRMLQYSDNPCAEKMFSELGSKKIQSRIEALGLTDTVMSRLLTSTKDASIVTGLINKGVGLSQQSTVRLRTAMLNQTYRNGLPLGLRGFEVGDKVGMYEAEYHDTAFVKTPNSESFVVTVFTESLGVSVIAELAEQIAPLLRL